MTTLTVGTDDAFEKHDVCDQKLASLRKATVTAGARTQIQNDDVVTAIPCLP